VFLLLSKKFENNLKAVCKCFQRALKFTGSRFAERLEHFRTVIDVFSVLLINAQNEPCRKNYFHREFKAR
jgi:hypothetical protein